MTDTDSRIPPFSPVSPLYHNEAGEFKTWTWRCPDGTFLPIVPGKGRCPFPVVRADGELEDVPSWVRSRGSA